jgi:hypothetical protein
MGEDVTYEFEAPDPPNHTIHVHLMAESDDSSEPDVQVWFETGPGPRVFVVDDLAETGCIAADDAVECEFLYPTLEGQTGPSWTAHVVNNRSVSARVQLRILFLPVEDAQ